MISLIKRLEALTGPSREVDAEIAKATGWTAVPWEFEGARGVAWYASGPEAYKECPHFTGSIDAALTLVPEGLVIKSTLCADRSLQIVESWFYHEDEEITIIDDNGPYIKHLPAIALCIAALKARETGNVQIPD